MQITREDLNPCTVKLTVVLESDQVQEGYNKAYKQISKRLRVPGFRPGHAPKAVLEPLISKEELNETAAEILVRNSFVKAVEKEGLKPDVSTRPAINILELDSETQKASYEAKVPMPPIVELGEYKGLPLVAEAVEVTEEEVQRQIDEFRKRRQTREAVTDRGVSTGDVAVVNVKLDGEGGDGRNFMVIAGQTFSQLDETIAGMKLEEMKHASLDFPADFQDKTLAGKSVSATVSINSLSAVSLPNVDDAFAKSLQTENVDELKDRVRAGLTVIKEQMVRDMAFEQLLTALYDKSTVHVSDNMWEDLAARRLNETANEQARAGKTMEKYAEENGMTIDSLVEAWRTQAKLQVERALLIRDVFTKEKLQLTNRDLNAELNFMAEELGMEPKTLLSALQENNSVEELQFRAISRKVGDLLIEKAEKTEAAPAEDAAQKPKAKKAKASKEEAAPAEDAPAAEKPKAKKAAKPKAE